MLNGFLAHLKSHTYCVLGAIIVAALTSYVTVAVVAVSDNSQAQAANEEVYVRAPFWAGNVAAKGMTVQRGEPIEPALSTCDLVLNFSAPVIGGDIGKTATGASDPVSFSKSLPTGTRLGNFGPPITCNGQYLYRAEILN